MLAVVEHEHRRSVVEGTHHPAPQVGDDRVLQHARRPDLGDPEQCAEGRQQVLAVVDRCELADDDARGRGQRGGDGLRQARLAESARAEHRDQAVLVERPGHRRDVVLPPDELVRRDPEPGPPDRVVGRGRRPAQELGVQPHELRGRVGPESVRQPSAVRGEHRECLRGPPVDVEGAHRSADRRVVEGRRVDLGEPGGRSGGGVAVLEQQDGEPPTQGVLDRGRAVGERRAQVPVDVRTRCTPPPAERCPHRCGVGCVHGPLRGDEVDVRRVATERVPRAGRHDETVRRRPAQSGDQGLQGRPGALRPVRTPELVDQCLGAECTAGCEHQRGQERPRECTGNGDLGAVRARHRHRSEDGDTGRDGHDPILVPAVRGRRHLIVTGEHAVVTGP